MFINNVYIINKMLIIIKKKNALLIEISLNNIATSYQNIL